MLLTDFKIFNKKVPVAIDDKDKSPLKKDITETKSITFLTTVQLLNLNLHHLIIQAIKKSNMLICWKVLIKNGMKQALRRTATYTNLDPGTYTFKVKGLNNKGNGHQIF